METWLIYVMFNVLVSNCYPFLLEDTFISTNKSKYFSILAQKT